MDSRSAILASLNCADMIVDAYLGDLSDAELMQRPGPGCNHINWQIGHLLRSDAEMVGGCVPGSMPVLPAGFNDKYDRSQADCDDAQQFLDKAALLGILAQQRIAIREALAKRSDADLDRESPESMRGYAPTVGAAFALVPIHWVMHAGQWVVVRRNLGRPPIF